jgi:glucose-1-phosphate thymidylyltransferase
MKGIILHGGHGTRLRPLTFTGPKQLIPIANKPISQYALEDLKEAGIREVAIVLGDIYPEKVKEYYGDGGRFGVRITYVYQGQPLGIAHAVGLCEEFVGDEPFVVYLGDNILRGGIASYAEVFERSNLSAMILLCKVKNPERFGVAKFDSTGNLIQLIEKPRQPPSPYALTGIYFFRPVIFEAIKKLKPSWRGELEITEAIQSLIDQKLSVGYKFVEGWWKDTGTWDDLLEANRLVLDEIHPAILGVVEDESSIQGRVFIDQDAVVRKGSIVRGPSVVGRKAIIESNAYIGPYTSIGHGVIIKRAQIENSIIMDGCMIDFDGRITDSIIGPFSVVTSQKPIGRRLILGERSFVEI